MDESRVNVREEIMRALENAEDPKDRAFLAILMRFVDHVERLFDDDEMLRRKVLNGDYDVHSEDHSYIAALKDRNAILAVDWVNKKIVEEDIARQDVRGYWRKFIETLIAQAPTAVVYGLLFIAGYKVIG